MSKQISSETDDHNSLTVSVSPGFIDAMAALAVEEDLPLPTLVMSLISTEKPLTDPVSIDRGIGPECWDHILTLIEHTKDRETQAAE